MNRRTFMQLGITASAGLLLPSYVHALARPKDPTNWNPGDVAHIIPTASHERILLKVSFRKAIKEPQLKIGKSRRVNGIKTDLEGRFWYFDAQDLQPDTQYDLQLISGRHQLCDSWPLKTFPGPDAKAQKLRILAYTCGGGYDSPPFEGKSTWLDMTARRQLLQKGLSFNPDIVVANGDHIYWDLKTSQGKPISDFMKANFEGKFGALDLSMAFNAGKNQPVFQSICDYQIAGLYGTALRSIPSFFLTDDHDMFENDEFDKRFATLPTDDYGLYAAELTQLMYYPEFLPDRNRPVWLRGAGRSGRPVDTNLLYGTIRYGNLFEGVLYDCRRLVDYKGDHARILPQWTEDWLLARTQTEDTAHFVHFPSLPFAYSSGKLGDWYPDVLNNEKDKIVLYKEKTGWQRGWLAQHQRIINSISSQQKRPAIMVQGDFHASGAGKILASAELDLTKNPVNIIMSGPLGTGDLAFPSAARATRSAPAQLIHMEEALSPTEKNGFAIIDITREKITAQLFTWRPPQSTAEIANLQPAITYEVAR